MRLAGMIAETDILTNGRLECGLGRGHAWLYGPSPYRWRRAVHAMTRPSIFWNLLLPTKSFLLGQVLQRKGRQCGTPAAAATPSQVLHRRHQRHHVSNAGEKGWGIFVPPLLPWKVLEGPLNIYKKACAEHSHQPDIVYIRPVYIDEDEKQVRKEVEQALLNFLAFNASPVESIHSEDKKASCGPKL